MFLSNVTLAHGKYIHFSKINPFILVKSTRKIYSIKSHMYDVPIKVWFIEYSEFDKHDTLTVTSVSTILLNYNFEVLNVHTCIKQI